jgi:hypothetical protein
VGSVELSAVAGAVSGVVVAAVAAPGWGWVETETKWAGREMVIGRANVKSIDGRWRVGCGGAVSAGTVGAAVSTGGVFDILFAVVEKVSLFGNGTD